MRGLLVSLVLGVIVIVKVRFESIFESLIDLLFDGLAPRMILLSINLATCIPIGLLLGRVASILALRVGAALAEAEYFAKHGFSYSII